MKKKEQSRMVCYCHGYTVDDIENDAAQHGKSLIFERIQQEAKAGNCDCRVKNPSGG